MISVSDLPALNATLNATSTVLLSLGFYFVRHRQLRAHKRCMLGAFVTSTLFLASYLIYHFQVLPGSVRFAGTGWSQSVYYAILLTHVVLAGIPSRGVEIAQRIAGFIHQIQKNNVETGVIDVGMYRDDVGTRSALPIVRESKLPLPLEERTVVVVDDVLYTGRTVSAAMDAINSF